MKTFRNTMVVLLLMLCLSLFVLPAAQAAAAAAAEDDLSLAKYYLRLYDFFPPGDDVESAGSIAELERAMQKYDPYFMFLDTTEVEAMSGIYDSTYVGIGIVMMIGEDEEIVLKAVYGDTVAARAGLLAGDILDSVDGVRLQGKSLSEVSELLAGDGVVDSMVSITIRRDYWTETYTMARKEMAIQRLTYWMLPDGVGYMQIERFTNATAEQVEAGIAYLSGLGMSRMVLDLRDCPGGVMYAAAEVTSMLLGGGAIYYSMDKDGMSSMYYNPPQLEKTNAPLAVLINEESASASELLAASLQDAGRGHLIGTPTYGKGYSQSLLELPSGNVLYFTSGKFVSRDFQDISSQGGLTPDKLVRDEEAQLTSAIEWLKTQSAVAVTLNYTISNATYSADGTDYTGAPAPFLKDGAAYVPAGLTLSRLGWSMTWENGVCYAQKDQKRLILDHMSGEVLSGNNTAAIITVDGNIFLPASFLRQLGYEVIWDDAAQKITINRKE